MNHQNHQKRRRVNNKQKKMKTGFDYLLDSADKLPSELADVVLGFNYINKFKILMNEYGLHYDQADLLEDLTFRAMFGEISATEFTAKLVSDGEVSPEVAHDLTIATQNEIVLQVKDLLEAKIAELEDNDSNENIKELDEKTTEQFDQLSQSQQFHPSQYQEEIDDSQPQRTESQQSQPNIIPIQKRIDTEVVNPTVASSPTPISTKINQPIVETQPVPAKQAPRSAQTVQRFDTLNDDFDAGFVEPKFKKYADLMGDESKQNHKNSSQTGNLTQSTNPTQPIVSNNTAINQNQTPTLSSIPNKSKPANIIRSVKPKSYAQIMNEMFGRAFDNNEPDPTARPVTQSPAVQSESLSELNSTPVTAQSSASPIQNPIATKGSTITISSPIKTTIRPTATENGAINNTSSDPYREPPKI
jgi:hypothetical protein